MKHAHILLCNIWLLNLFIKFCEINKIRNEKYGSNYAVNYTAEPYITNIALIVIEFHYSDDFIKLVIIKYFLINNSILCNYIY